MTQTRQTPRPVDEDRILVRSLGLHLPSGHELPPHAHPWDQLVHATEGVMTVTVEAGSWVVPPARAVWIPAGLVHAVRTRGRVRMRTLYLRPDLADRVEAAWPATCRVVAVSSLARELVLAILRIGMLLEGDAHHRRLVELLAHELRGTGEAPLELRTPLDPRARQVADAIRADPASTSTLAELAGHGGASPRTIERLFRRDTGLTFVGWRQRARALHALERLVTGDTVTEAALAAGYDSTSAFIAMFRRVLGTTPGRVARERARPSTVASSRDRIGSR